MLRGWTVRNRTLLLGLAAASLLAAALVNFQQRRAFVLPDDGVRWAEGAGGVRAAEVVRGGAADKAGIQPGDRLVAIEGVGIDSELDVPRVLNRVGAWHSAEYAVERGGVEWTLPLVVEAASINPPVYYFQWILGLVYLAIGAVVWLRRPAGEMVFHFCVFCLSSFVLYAFSYTGELDGLDRFIYWSDVWATLLVPAIFLHFCLIFPGSARVGAARRRLSALVYLPAAALLGVHHAVAAGLVRFETPLVELRFLLDRIEYGLLGIEFVVGALALHFWVGRTEHPLLRQQRNWLAQGALWGALPFALFYVWPYAAGESLGAGRSLAVFSLGLIPLAFAYAIFKYRLMDVELAVRRGMAYSAAAAALLFVFYSLLWMLSSAAGPSFAEWTPALWVGSLVAGAVLFQPLRARIERTFEKRRYRERYDYRRTLVEFASELSTETNLERMLAAVRDRLADTLDVERLGIFIAGPAESASGAAGLRLAAGRGLRNGRPGPIESGSLDLGFLNADGGGFNGSRRFVFFDDPAHVESKTPSQRRSLAALDLNYYVPCTVRGRTIAYFGLGLTRSGDYLSSEDLSLVQAVSGNFAIALENARLYHSLEEKVNEFERLKDYNENIVESLSVGILAVDLDDRVESWNTQLELTFGISRDQAVGRRLNELLPARLAAELEDSGGDSGVRNIHKFLLRAAEFPAEFRPAEVGDARSAERTLTIAVAPLIAKNFKRIGRLIILDDVTERVELEEQLVQADKLSSIGLLAAGVAHEVNTPLAVISSHAQMLAKRVSEDSQQARILRKITAQTFRASEIVNSLLNFSRTSKREKEPLRLSRVLQETLALIEPQLRQGRIEVRTEFSAEADTIVGDAGKLQQVFLNLFINACDAMPEGGTLRVATLSAEADGESLVRVEVTDSGVGISADDLKKIFDPFFTTKSGTRGTGLGLAVSYGIVREHSGTISVDSTPGRGASFRIDLPPARKTVHA